MPSQTQYKSSLSCGNVLQQLVYSQLSGTGYRNALNASAFPTLTTYISLFIPITCTNMRISLAFVTLAVAGASVPALAAPAGRPSAVEVRRRQADTDPKFNLGNVDLLGGLNTFLGVVNQLGQVSNAINQRDDAELEMSRRQADTDPKFNLGNVDLLGGLNTFLGTVNQIGQASNAINQRDELELDRRQADTDPKLSGGGFLGGLSGSVDLIQQIGQLVNTFSQRDELEPELSRRQDADPKVSGGGFLGGLSGSVDLINQIGGLVNTFLKRAELELELSRRQVADPKVSGGGFLGGLSGSVDLINQIGQLVNTFSQRDELELELRCVRPLRGSCAVDRTAFSAAVPRALLATFSTRLAYSSTSATSLRLRAYIHQMVSPPSTEQFSQPPPGCGSQLEGQRRRLPGRSERFSRLDQPNWPTRQHLQPARA
ncbi:hypothetical protein FA95DRAFT_1563740 [Auriscalpium vulgare]|uniref:Uncharacterized protein n=1 Tax=Auriscalpium vulgare TaxID=40419 RepID=A0ACB8RHD3_9AGAM|nr:hypothetical protein FA95DRAFT_1563740 [Auriscalpium vulgare]